MRARLSLLLLGWASWLDRPTAELWAESVVNAARWRRAMQNFNRAMTRPIDKVLAQFMAWAEGLEDA